MGLGAWADDIQVHRIKSPAALEQGPAQPPSPQAQHTQPPLQLQPGWPSLQTLLNLPGWFTLAVNVNSEPMGGSNAAKQPTGAAAWMQQVVITTSVNTGATKPVQQWQELDHWTLRLQLSSFNGNPNLNLALGTAFPLQTLAHPVGLWMTEASLQRISASGDTKVRAGLLSLEPSFIENGVLDTYNHSALNNTLNLLIPGLPINPLVTPGAELHWRTSPSAWLRIGSYWLDSETALAAMFGVNPDQPNVRGTMQVVQWSLSDLGNTATLAKPIPIAGARAVSRQLPDPLLQLGAYTTTASSSLRPGLNNQGVYATLTLPLAVPVGLDNHWWVAISSGFNSEANPYPLFLAGGWLSQGVLRGRPLDVLALAFGRTSFSPQLTPGSSEGLVELNYSINLNSQLSVQPLVQWIVNPGGQNTGSGAWAAGMQVKWRI